MTRREAMALISPHDRDSLAAAVRFFGCEEGCDGEEREGDEVIDLGDGYGGYGVYVWCGEYPDEGSVFFGQDPATRALRGNRRIAARLAEIRARTQIGMSWGEWILIHGGDWANIADFEKELGRGEP